MKSDRYEANFSVGDHEVAAKLELLSGEAEPIIKNHIAKNELGTAEVVLVVSAVKKLWIDGESHNLQANKPFPRHRDPETGESLLVKLVKVIVAEEKWLANVQPFSRVFAKYEDEPENPTRTESLKEAKTGA